jgi:hypothetical protein
VATLSNPVPTKNNLLNNNSVTEKIQMGKDPGGIDAV